MSYNFVMDRSDSIAQYAVSALISICPQLLDEVELRKTLIKQLLGDREFLEFCGDGEGRPMVRLTVKHNDKREFEELWVNNEIPDTTDRSLISSSIVMVRTGTEWRDDIAVTAQISCITSPVLFNIEGLTKFFDSDLNIMLDNVISMDSVDYSSSSLNETKRRFRDTVVSLYRLIDDIETPQLDSSIPEQIKIAVRNGATEANYKDFIDEDELNDTKFQHQLRHSAIAWKKSLSTIIDFTNSIPSGTIEEEKNSWQKLVTVIDRIIEQLSIQENKITYALLKETKISNISMETLLDGEIYLAHTKLKRYIQFLHDIPSSIENYQGKRKEQVTQFITNTFFSLSKFPSVNYPLERTIELLNFSNKHLIAASDEYYANISQMEEKTYLDTINEIKDYFKLWNEKLSNFKLIIREYQRKSNKDYSKITTLLPDNRAILNSIESFSKIRAHINALINCVSYFAYTGYSEDIKQLENILNPISSISDQVRTITDTNMRSKKLSAEIERKIINHFEKISAKNNLDAERRIVKSVELLREISPHSKVIQSEIVQYMNRVLSFTIKEVNHISSQPKDTPRELVYYTPTGVDESFLDLHELHSTMTVTDSYTERLSIIFGADWKKTTKGQSLINIIQSLDIPSALVQKVNEWSSNILIQNEKILEQPIMKIIPQKGGTFEIMQNLEMSLAVSYRDLKNLVFLDLQLNPVINQLLRKNQIIYQAAEELKNNMSLFLIVLEKCKNSIFLWNILQNDITYIWKIIKDIYHLQWSIIIKKDSLIGLINSKIDILMNDYHQIIELEKNLQIVTKEISPTVMNPTSLSTIIKQIETILNELVRTKIKPGIISNAFDPIRLYLSKKFVEAIIAWIYNYEFSFVNITLKIVDNSILILPDVHDIKQLWIEEFHSSLKQISSLINLKVDGLEILNPTDILRTLLEFTNPLGRKMEWISNQVSLLQVELETLINNILILETNESMLVIPSSDSKSLISLCDDILYLISHIPLTTYVKTISSNLKINIHEIGTNVNTKILALVKAIFGPLITLESSMLDEVLGFLKPLELKIPDFEESINNPDSVKLMISSYFYFSNKSESLKQKIDKINSVHEKINALETFQNQNTSSIFPISDLFSNIESNLTFLMEKLDSNKSILIKVLKNEQLEYQNISENVINYWSSRNSVFKDSSLENSIAFFKKLKNETESLEQSKEFIDKSIKLFKIDQLQLVQILDDEVHHTVTNILCDLTTLESLHSRFNSLSDTKISNLIENNIELHLSEIKEKLLRLKAVLNEFSCYQCFLDKILYYSNNFHLLKNLCSDFLKPRHIQRLYELLEIDQVAEIREFTKDNLKVSDISLHLLIARKLEIERLIEEAQQEEAFEKSLNEIATFWDNKKLVLKTNQFSIPVVDDWDELRSKMNDDTDDLYAMRSSPFNRTFKKQIEDLTNDILNLANIISSWEECQLLMIEFSKIFMNSVIKQLMPMESTRFSNLKNTFNDLLNQVLVSPFVPHILKISNLSSTFSSIVQKMQALKNSFAQFLNTQRNDFPKFYFLNDDDLLDILGGGVNVQTISKHLRKIYQSIGSLIVVENYVRAVKSVEGEVFEFRHIIDLSSVKSPKELLKKVDEAIKTTIAGHVTELCNKNWTIADIFPKYIYQVILLSIQIRYSNSLIEYGRTLNRNIIENGILSLSSHIATLQDIRKNSGEELTNKLKSEGLMLELMKFKKLFEDAQDLNTNYNEIGAFLDNKMLYSHNNTEICDDSIVITVNNTQYAYEFNYIGVPEHLVDTDILNSAHKHLLISFTQSYGSCLEGPAGTGKTEAIKYLGTLFGKIVTIFNCDDLIDFSDLFRILIGVINMGLWVSFDEFNRLDNSVMSSISELIHKIQKSLQDSAKSLLYYSREFPVNPETRIFITLNPNYSGRKPLPTNLRKLFRHFNYMSSDTQQIIETFLTILGWEDSRNLSIRLANLYSSLETKCSKQLHYDFSLRSTKLILRALLNNNLSSSLEENIIKLTTQIVCPRLTEEDFIVFHHVLSENFPNSVSPDPAMKNDLFVQECKQMKLVPTEYLRKKFFELLNIYDTSTSIIMLGETGNGKTATLKLLKYHIEMNMNQKVITFFIDPKLFSKRDFFGYFHRVTLEWIDGVFTQVIRNCINEENDNQYWIFFDSELDSNFMEALNSMLDDNKLLSLGNGERLKISQNIKLICESDSVKNLTPATISRSNVIYFASSTISDKKLLNYKLNNILPTITSADPMYNRKLEIIRLLEKIVTDDMLMTCFEFSKKIEEGFTITAKMAIENFVILLENFIFSNSLFSTVNISDNYEGLKFISIKYLGIAFTSHLNNKEKATFIHRIQELLNVRYWKTGQKIGDLSLSVEDLQILDTDHLLASDSFQENVQMTTKVIPTVDTLLITSVLKKYIEANHSFILFGPPGSGKTMLIKQCLCSIENIDIVLYSLSAATTTCDIIRFIKKHCSIVNMGNSIGMVPRKRNKMVFFFDEINLPQTDKVGSHNTSLLLRQLVDKNGFWDTQIKRWVTLKDIIMVGACNPTNFIGRKNLPIRFLRYFSPILIEYPSSRSLKRIYLQLTQPTFILIPKLNNLQTPIVSATLDIYQKFNKVFSITGNPRYITSPRELTKLVQSFHNSILEGPSFIDHQFLVRLWLFQCWHIFADRLELHEERKSFEVLLLDVCREYFKSHINVDFNVSDLLFTNINRMEFQESSFSEMNDFLSHRFEVFKEENRMDSKLFLDYFVSDIISTERIMRQHTGHGLYVGPPCVGKKTIIQFTAWLLGVNYNEFYLSDSNELQDLFNFLKNTISQSLAKNTKECLVIECSNTFDVSFLERINDLLANSDLPDIYDTAEKDSLLKYLNDNKFSAAIESDKNDTSELNRLHLATNLHLFFVVSVDDLNLNNGIINSPTIINRCNLKWFPPWSSKTFLSVGKMQLELIPFPTDKIFEENELEAEVELKYTDKISTCLLEFDKMQRSSEKFLGNSPCYFVGFIMKFKEIYLRELEKFETSRNFKLVGLQKLNETLLSVQTLTKKLTSDKTRLEAKEAEARETLDKMLIDQNEVERKHEATIEIKKILEKQELAIKEHKKTILSKIEEIKPILDAARQGVKNIKKEHLIEMRSLMKPPVGVRLILAAVCMLIGYQFSDWKEIQSIIRKDEFIRDIVYFDSRDAKCMVNKENVKKEYLTNPSFTYEVINRASKACGPLYNWIMAQISYSDVIDQVEPYETEIKNLEDKSLHHRAKIIAAEGMISDLNNAMDISKHQYAELIGDVENIKRSISSHSNQLERSKTLLNSLSIEKRRWSQNQDKYLTQKHQLIGNSIVEAASYVYFSYLDEHEEYEGKVKLNKCLVENKILFDQNFSFNVNVVPQQYKNRFKESNIANDQFLTSRLYLLTSNERCIPFVIDTQKDILQHLNLIYDQNIIILDLSDNNIMKRLRKAVEFGSNIIIENANILDISLYQQIAKLTNGRESSKILFLSQSPNINLTPYVAARISIVDFSVTEGSIAHRSLNCIISALEPAIENNKRELEVLHGDLLVKLTHLEEALLEEINNNEGAILDNNTLMLTLEQLKKESDKINEKILETENHSKQMDQIIQKYQQLSRHIVDIFLITKKLVFKGSNFPIIPAKILEYIQFAIQTKITNISGENDDNSIESWLTHIYNVLLSIISLSFDHETSVIFQTLLFEQRYGNELTSDNNSTSLKHQITNFLNDILKSETLSLSGENVPTFIQKRFTNNITNAFDSFMHCIQQSFKEEINFTKFINNIKFPYILLINSRKKDGTVELIDNFDATIDAVIPLGASENLSWAEKKLQECSSNGGTVILQNIELSFDWVQQFLTGFLEQNRSNKTLKIFMTYNESTKIQPEPVFNIVDKVYYEGENNMISMVRNMFRKQPPELESKFVFFKFVSSWMHSIINFKCYYSPNGGFSKNAYFDETDFLFLLEYARGYIYRYQDDSKIFWCKIRSVIVDIVYGSQLDTLEDKNVLEATVDKVLPHSFDEDFSIEDTFTIRCGSSIEEYDKILDTLELPKDWKFKWLEITDEAIQNLELSNAKRIATKILDILEDD